MRGEVYPALFRCTGRDVERLTGHEVAAPAAVAAAWARLGEPLLLAGNGLRKYGDLFVAALGEAATVAPPAAWTPTGEALLLAAWRARRAGTLGDGDAGTLLPVYTRLSDAEETERQRAGLPRFLSDNGVAGPCATPETR
jgi:N6-L-threonylcarbamoyladenine synthase/protein kinase Bud32